MTNVPVSGMHKGCPNCGGLLRYDIESEQLKCHACGELTAVSHYDDNQQEDPKTHMQVLEYRCPQCGATVHTTETNLISYCNHCGSEVVFNQRMTETKRPHWIVPFKVTRDKCEEIYRQHVKKALYAPKSSRQAMEASRFQPMYVPFYLYGCNFTGKSLLYYDKHESYGNSDVRKSFKQALENNIHVTGELQCAATQVDPVIADGLGFSLQQKVRFSPAYLCGFNAEAPDLLPNENEDSLAVYAKHYTRENTKQILIGIETENTSVKFLNTPETNVETVLLPVWLLGEKQGERVLYTAINGIDGSIICEPPVQQSKTYLLGAILGVLLAALLIQLSSVIILRSKLIAGLCALLTAACYYVVEGALVKLKQRDQNIKERLKATHSDRLSTIDLPITAQNPNTKKKHFRFTFWEWLIRHFPLFLLCGGFIALNMMIGKNRNEMVAGLVSDNGWLAPYLCFASALSVVLVFFNVRKATANKQNPLSPWVVGLVLAAIGVLMLQISNQWLYYGIAIGLIALMIGLTACLTFKHNHFVTRPTPYFGGKKEEAA